MKPEPTECEGRKEGWKEEKLTWHMSLSRDHEA